MRVQKNTQVIGILRGTRSGFAFLSPDEGGEDLFVPYDAQGGAIHGDRVLATVVHRGFQDFRPEAHVEEILDRPNPLFTGNVARLGKSWTVRPDSPLLPERIGLRLGTGQGVAGEKILFRLENRANRERTPMAVFVEALGDEEDARLDPIVIASEYGLALRFSDEALAEAEATSRLEHVPEDEDREDFRDQFVLSIDPIDAKDFDDAIAVVRKPGGNFELTVHIADVTFYVPEGGPLDREAAIRGTSVYFPGTVVPMLPESISSAAASLGPESDKRVLSARMLFNAEGERLSARFSRGWMRSRARLHYRQAADLLVPSPARPAEGEPIRDEAAGNGDGREWPELRENLLLMAELARLLRRRRFRDGGFDLDVPETEMVLGADGVPVRVFRHETLESNRLIEEFMIAANRAVGEWALERGVPFLFRVHQEPDPEALARFEETVLTLMPGTPVAELSSLPRLRRWISSLPETALGRVVHRFFLRSMRKAIYSPIDVGHFGLGISGYCHFTSPIRRYPDLFNHRRLIEMIRNEEAEERQDVVHALANTTSRAEINAEESSREMIRLKSARFMEGKLGQEFAGHVAALTPNGLFVELDLFPVDGFVPRRDLPAGVKFDEERLAWIEERSGWELRPGDPVRALVSRVDLRMRRIEFALVSENSPKRPPLPLPRTGEAVPAGRRGRGRGAETEGSDGRGRTGRRRRGEGVRAEGSETPGGRTGRPGRREGRTGSGVRPDGEGAGRTGPVRRGASAGDAPRGRASADGGRKGGGARKARKGTKARGSRSGVPRKSGPPRKAKTRRR